MIGAITGDIVGSIYEFDNLKSKDFTLFGEGCKFTENGGDKIVHRSGGISLPWAE